jgi:hypothetical protein
MRVIACFAVILNLVSSRPGTYEENYIEKTRAYEEATGMVCEIINNNGIIGGRTCKTSPETMKRKLEELKQEKEATTGLKCEVDEETHEVSCIGQTKDKVVEIVTIDNKGAETVVEGHYEENSLKATKADEKVTDKSAETGAVGTDEENNLEKTKATDKGAETVPVGNYEENVLEKTKVDENTTVKSAETGEVGTYEENTLKKTKATDQGAQNVAVNYFEQDFLEKTKAFEKASGMTCVVEKNGNQFKRNCKNKAASDASAGGARGGEIVPPVVDAYEAKFREETKAYENSTGMKCVVEKNGSQLKRRCKSA